jgi:hypothetical protein
MTGMGHTVIIEQSLDWFWLIVRFVEARESICEQISV